MFVYGRPKCQDIEYILERRHVTETMRRCVGASNVGVSLQDPLDSWFLGREKSVVEEDDFQTV